MPETAQESPGRQRRSTGVAARPLRICLVTPAYPPMVGGIARYTWDLAQGLTGRGHDVVVLVAAGKRPESAADGAGGPRVRWLVDTTPTARLLRTVPGGTDLRRSLQVAREIRSLHAERPFDVVECASWRALGAAHSLRKSAPQLLRATTAIAQVPKESGGWTDRLRDLAGRRVLDASERVCLARSERVIAPTESHLQSLPPRIRSTGGVMPFGIPAPVGEPRRSGDTVLYVGRLSGRKGFDLFASAASLLLAEDASARIVIAGKDHIDDTGSMWEKHGEPLSRRYGERVAWRGEVSDAELEELYWTSDVCAVPSRYESFGLVFLEANSHGLPVVAWNTAFGREVAGPGARLVTPWDARAYADALHDTLRSAAGAPLTGQGLRELTAERYGMERFVERTESLYREMAAAPAQRTE
ncbi:glycosyltransferase family 4 protein [Streptomyces sp. PU-14G]|uniref:glycosyltransferase family 4 protein n=1 Tax=Streptomyces sp. PU-14G TaxID=2800808 RepID=UPI0034DE26D5